MDITKGFRRFRQYALNSRIPSKRRIDVFLDYILSRIFLGAGLEEYFRNEFYSLNWSARREYYTIRKKKKAHYVFNKKDFIDEIDNKVKFNQNFASFLGREWISLADCSEETFLEFTKKHTQCFVKECDGLQGINAQNPDFRELEAKVYYKQYSGKPLIMEEAIRQCDEIAAFNRCTVNTIRVLTIVDQHKNVHILGAAFRIGRVNQITDNFHNHGIAADIDVETGIVYTTGVDRDFKRYVVHPDSKKPIVGFSIPRWNEICKSVREAALIYPEVRYVGWDIAIGQDRILFIEGNSTACPDVLEMPCRQGLWKTLKPYTWKN